MKEGFKKCPKCKGKGKKAYIYFQIGTILRNLALLKKGSSVDNLNCSERHIKLICPFCEGSGAVDWINWARRKNFSKPFSNLEGCLDIFLNQIPVKQWVFNPPDHNELVVKNDLSEYSNPEKIIKLSQDRYDKPVKLNNDFLSMTSNDLARIADVLAWHHLAITEPYSEENILEYLKKKGLYQYKPDKFAHPELNDIDEKFF